jgi:site-specific recombinase XerD
LSERSASLSEVRTISDTALQYLDAAALSDDRVAAYRRLLSEIESALGPMPVRDIAALATLLDAKHAAGISPNTIRKHVGMIRAFYAGMYEHGHVTADTLLAVRAIKPPQGSSRGTKPQPYNRTELRTLRATLDQRWPKLPPDEADRWLRRVKDGRSPYSRVRVHVIRCQLDAIIALALHLGLRRREIFALGIHEMHYFNQGVVVRDKFGGLERAREAPMTCVARDAIYEWLTCRAFLGADHNGAWLNLHSETTKSAPMNSETFATVLKTYVAPGYTLKRLRDTCAVAWVRAELPLEFLRQLLGLSSIEETLPYARLVRGSLDGRMEKLDTIFTDLVEPAEIAA